MANTSITTTTLLQDGGAQRQSSFLAGHTNSGPINAPNTVQQQQRLTSEASSYPSQYIQAQQAYGANQSQQAYGANQSQQAYGASQSHQTYGASQSHQTYGASQHEEVYYQGMQVIGESVVEHDVVVPVRKIVEEVVEKIVVVPEKRQREEIVEDHRVIRERIIKVAKPVEQIVYVDEPQYVEVDKIEYVPQTIKQDNPVYKDVWNTVEVVKEVPKYVDRVREQPYDVIEYVQVPVQKVVEVPETRIIEKTVEKPVPRYVEVEVPDYKTVEVIQEVHRAVPQPVEVITEEVYKAPMLDAEYEEVLMPIFVPQFTEVPLPLDYLTDASCLQMQELSQRIALESGQAIPSLCVLEDLGEQAKRMQPELIKDPAVLSQRMAAKIEAFHQNSVGQ